MKTVAALYARVSTTVQEEEATIDIQIAAIERYAQKREYEISAEHTGYLSGRKYGIVATTDGMTVNQVMLRGGDVYQSSAGCVTISDVVRVASVYGEAVPPAPAELDLNKDGEIKIGDMAIVGGNFDRCESTWE